MPRRPIVAIDGPAASGKSSTALLVARALGFCHVDSGALYRTLTLLAQEGLGAPETWRPDALVAAARACGVAAVPDGLVLEVRVAGRSVGDAIRTEAVTREVSRVAAMPAVRDFVNVLLREAARDGGVVMDGRDIGTVVFPQATLKVFLRADLSVRARRRSEELRRQGIRQTEEEVARIMRAACRRRMARLAEASSASPRPASRACSAVPSTQVK